MPVVAGRSLCGYMLKVIGAALAAASLLVLAALIVGQSGVSYGHAASSDVPMQGTEKLSPADRVSWEQIAVDSNGVLIGGLSNVRLVGIADTNSMDPVLDAESTVVGLSRALALGDAATFGGHMSKKTDGDHEVDMAECLLCHMQALCLVVYNEGGYNATAVCQPCAIAAFASSSSGADGPQGRA